VTDIISESEPNGGSLFGSEVFNGFSSGIHRFEAIKNSNRHPSDHFDSRTREARSEVAGGGRGLNVGDEVGVSIHGGLSGGSHCLGHLDSLGIGFTGLLRSGIEGSLSKDP
jgi:hypothetical protein